MTPRSSGALHRCGRALVHPPFTVAGLPRHLRFLLSAAGATRAPTPHGGVHQGTTKRSSSSVNISPFRRRALAAAIAGTLVLAACGDDDDDDTSATTAAAAPRRPTAAAETTAGGATTTRGPARDDRARPSRPPRRSGGHDRPDGAGERAPSIGAGASSQAAAMQAWTGRVPGGQPRRHRRSTTRSAPAADARRSSPAAPTSPAPTPALERRGAREVQGASAVTRARSTCRTTSRRSSSPTTCPTSTSLNLSPATAAGHLLRRDHDVERRRRSPPTTPTSSCRTRRSTRCTARTSRARRRTSPTTSHAVGPDVWTEEAGAGVAGELRW